MMNFILINFFVDVLSTTSFKHQQQPCQLKNKNKVSNKHNMSTGTIYVKFILKNKNSDYDTTDQVLLYIYGQTGKG